MCWLCWFVNYFYVYLKIYIFKIFKITNNWNFLTGKAFADQRPIFADQQDRDRPNFLNPNFLNLNESQIAFPTNGTKILFPVSED